MGWPTKEQRKQAGLNKPTTKVIAERPPSVGVAAPKEEVMQQATQPRAEETLSQMDEIRQAPRVKIIVDEQDNHEGNKDVHLGINGYVITIQRGKPVSIPEPFVKLLENLKYKVISKNENGEDVEREVPRYHWRKVA